LEKKTFGTDRELIILLLKKEDPPLEASMGVSSRTQGDVGKGGEKRKKVGYPKGRLLNPARVQPRYGIPVRRSAELC